MSAHSPEDGKRAAAEAAASFVEDGMTVGLGTGTTIAHFLPALARRNVSVRCVATSPATERAARDLGFGVEPFDGDGLLRVDLAVDGADQVRPDLWLVKGRGGAHTREKIVAAAAERFVVIVDWTKVVAALRPPVPLELMPFGLSATIRLLSGLGPVRPRDDSATPDGNVLADFEGEVDDPAKLRSALDAVPGVVGHGLFPPDLVTAVLVGRADGEVERLTR
jgi:ribose 5-phosphate isomerase A